MHFPLSDELASRILLVDGNYSGRKRIYLALTQGGYRVSVLARAIHVPDLLRKNQVDLVLMATESGGMEACGDIRMLDELRMTSIILYSGKLPAEEMVVQGLMAGADDFISMPSRLHELLARVRVQLRNRRDRELLLQARQQCISLQDAALQDPLTGLANRRALDIALKQLLDAHSRLVLCIIDVDHFKRINDTYGHNTGDLVLKELAHVLQQGARAGDVVGRLGGEEFIVLCDAVPANKAVEIAERLRACVAAAEMPIPEGKITVSVGAVEVEDPGQLTAEGLKELADEALYYAKNQGRNRAVLWSPNGMLLCHRGVA
jgi:two-component system cell cycle response regulator